MREFFQIISDYPNEIITLFLIIYIFLDTICTTFQNIILILKNKYNDKSNHDN